MGRKLKEFKFQLSKDLPNTEEASLTLTNGYTVHVIKGQYAAHVYGAPYELYITPIVKEITDDSIGYLSDIELLKLVDEIETLPKLSSHT